jgi:hypothetical protein
MPTRKAKVIRDARWVPENKYVRDVSESAHAWAFFLPGMMCAGKPENPTEHAQTDDLYELPSL